MKRFTLIFSLLMVVCFGVKAQEVYVTDLNDLSNEKTYLIESQRCVLINSANVTTGLATTNGTAVGTVKRDLTDNNQLFKIEKDGENYYLYSVGASKYVTDGGAWSDTKGTALTITNVSSANAGYPWKLGLGSNYLNSQDPNQTAAGIMVNGWSTTDPGNCYRFVDVEATKALQIVEITYNFVFEGETVYTETVSGVIGQAYPDYTAMPLGVSAAAKPSTNVTAAETVNIEVAFTTLPFEYAATYEEIEHWYYAQMHGNFPSYLFSNGTGEEMVWKVSNNLVTTFGAADADAYTWAFVGNPFGFKMVNKAGGAIKSTGSGNVRIVESLADATSFRTVAPQTNNNGKGDVGFCMFNAAAGQYMNAQNVGINHWTSNDAGSTIWVTERNDNEISVSDLGYATLYLGEPVFIPAEVEAYVVSSVVGEYAQMTPVTGILPANTGVILKNAGDHTFTTAPAADAITENLLAGTLETTEITKVEGNSYYVLANGKNGVGLYNPTIGEDATKFNNAANKAYLVVPATEGSANVASYSFRFGEGTTGVENVVVENEVKAIYDLTGRRVENISAPGIYIVGGRKVLVK